MGAGCCHARILPGPASQPWPQPRTRPGRVIIPGAPRHGFAEYNIASLRPGDKFIFHPAVPEKAFSPPRGVGVLNHAFSLDGGLAVRPVLPPPPPGSTPVPPPRRKRRSRPPGTTSSRGQAQAPPQPPSRCRARAARAARARSGLEALEAADDATDDEHPTTDSILSPAHTLELLKRMAKMEAHLGRPLLPSQYALPPEFQRARSLDNLDRKESSTSTALAFPGLRTPRHSSNSFTQGPRSLDSSRTGDEGESGREATFILRSWEDRKRSLDYGQAFGEDTERTPNTTATLPLTTSTTTTIASTMGSNLSNSTVLLSPQKWRPLSPSSLSPDSSLMPSEHQTATRRALSEFIMDTYDAAANGPSLEIEATPTDSPQAPPAELPSGSDSRRDSDSSASSTTESLGELEDDILHMLSSSCKGEDEEAQGVLAAKINNVVPERPRQVSDPAIDATSVEVRSEADARVRDADTN